MIRKIRPGVFETNSSMTHACVILPQEQYDKWKDEKLYYCEDNWSFRESDSKPIRGNLYSEEEALSFVDPEEINDYESTEECLVDNGFLTYDMFFYSEYLESESTNYTTPGGKKIVVCCRYGADY